MSSLDIRVGQVVLLANGVQATVRYVGQTAFRAGTWIGVELSTPTGKNNGCVAGVRYFDVPENCGLFLTHSGVKQILRDRPDDPAPAAPPPDEPRKLDVHASAASRRVSSIRDNGTPSTSAGARTRTNSLARRADLTSGRGSRSSVASVSSGSGGGSAGGSNPFNPDGRLQPETTIRRTKVAAGADRRTTLRPSIPGSAKPVPTPRTDRSPVKRSAPVTSTTTPTEPSFPSSPKRPTATPAEKPTPMAAAEPPEPRQSRAPPPTSSSTTGPVTTGPPNSQIQDLQSKIRLLERRRLEDREKIGTLDSTREERDRYKAALSRLQAKVVNQQSTLTELRQQLAEAEALSAGRADADADIETQLEMATLDREVAEEQAELYRAELAEARLRLEELQLELEIAGTEKRELEGPLSADEKHARGWVQMERENERLREALLRLRDLSRAETSELQDRVKGLEAELAAADGFRTTAEESQIRAEQAETIANELRSQLDAAEEAADMVEQLSSRNMALAEQVSRLQEAVRDLETLRELSEEVEQSQLANERQLLEMLDEREGAAGELARKVIERDDLLADQAFAIERLRAAVERVQAEAAAERMAHEEKVSDSHARDVAELAELSSQLHRNATGALGRQIEGSILKVAAEEGPLAWKMLGPMVPAELSPMVRAVKAVMLARRVGAKAGIVAQVLRDGLGAVGGVRADRRGLAIGVAVERAADVARLSGQLSVISGLCGRIVGWVDSVSPTRLVEIGTRIAELGPVERTVDWVSDMIHRELDIVAAVDGIGRSVAVVRHVAEFLVPSTESESEDEYQFAHDHATRVLSACDLAIALVRLCGCADGFPLDRLLSSLGSARIPAAQAARSLVDLHNRGLVPPSNIVKPLVECADLVDAELSRPIGKIAEAVLSLVYDPARSEPLTSAEIVSAVGSVDGITAATSRIIGLLSPVLPVDVASAPEVGHVVAPWDKCAAQLEESAAAASATTDQLRAATAELTDVRVKLRMIRSELDDTKHERDVLSSRFGQASARANAVPGLEKDLAERIKAEQAAMSELAEREREIAGVRREMAELVAQIGTSGAAGRDSTGAGLSGAQADHGSAGRNTLASDEALVSAARVSGLEGAVRYLSAVIDSKTRPGSDLSWLAEDEQAKVRAKQARVDRLRHREATLSTVSQLAGLPERVQFVRLNRVGTTESADIKTDQPKTDAPKTPADESGAARAPSRPRNNRLGWQPIRSTTHYQLFEQQLLALDVWSAPGRRAVGLARANIHGPNKGRGRGPVGKGGRRSAGVVVHDEDAIGSGLAGVFAGPDADPDEFVVV